MTNTHVTTVTKVIARIKPCRYFQFGSGLFSHRSGECRYDHIFVTDKLKYYYSVNFLQMIDCNLVKLNFFSTHVKKHLL